MLVFERAVQALEAALRLPKDDITRDASIQRFEFCVELAWKEARRAMGTSASAPKQVIREMARAGLIDDAAFWLTAIDKRNLSSHTYIEALADDVYAFATLFAPRVRDLLQKLHKLATS